MLGAFMATSYGNLLLADSRKSLNKIVFVVFTALLMSAGLAKTVKLEDIIPWWLMPVDIRFTFLFGGILGGILVKILRSKPHLESLIVATFSSDMAISSNFDNLPREIMSEIMLRLPADSLMQFKSVNKSFHSLVSSLVEDPKFVAKHLRYSEADASTPTSFLMYGRCRRCNPRVQEQEFYVKSGVLLLTIFGDRGNKNVRIHCVIEDLSLPLDTVIARKGNPSILDTVFCLEAYHCNGIICLAKGGGKIVLYNPTLHKYKTFVLESLSNRREILGTGFGWDSRANKYKFVRISCDYNDDPIAAVYDFGTNHSWREISLPEYVHSTLYSCVYCEGTCYWLMCYAELIISFDMRSEEFDTINLPDDCQQYEDSALRLALKDDSVCLFQYPSEPVDRGQILESIQMWRMDISSNDGVQWKNFITIEHFEEIYYPSTFWKSDELLMKTEFGRVVSYNIGTRKLRDLHLPLLGMEHKSIPNPVPFTKSLVPLDWRKLA